MFRLSAILASALTYVSASHLDNNNGIFDTFSFDMVKFKTKTNCALDKHPEVSHYFHSSASMGLLVQKMKDL